MLAITFEHHNIGTEACKLDSDINMKPHIHCMCVHKIPRGKVNTVIYDIFITYHVYYY